MSFGLILGAGGVQGVAWLCGALAALREETGLEPARAERLVGTSAGSIVVAGLAAGLSPERIAALQPTGPAPREEPAPGGGWPGSPRLALAALARPFAYRPAVALTGWLPQGAGSLAPLREMIGREAPRGWGHHRGLRIVACDYESGRRVCFGAPEAPPAPLPHAVAASCAIPGVFRPVEIAGRRYVDGGVHSPSNLDLVAGEGLDLVICLNPTSARAPLASARPADWLVNGVRGASAWRLRREAARVRASGTRVLVIEPTAEDVRQMGVDLMSPIGRGETAVVARRTTAERLRREGAFPV